jgi:hypothetical protein
MRRSRLFFGRRLSDGLIYMNGTLWTRGRVRGQAKFCLECGEKIARGSWAWRTLRDCVARMDPPVQRYERVCGDCALNQEQVSRLALERST